MAQIIFVLINLKKKLIVSTSKNTPNMKVQTLKSFETGKTCNMILTAQQKQCFCFLCICSFWSVIFVILNYNCV